MVVVRLLGTVQVAVAGAGWRPAGPAKQACVLAALATTPGRPVSVKDLTGMVWGAGAPVAAPNVLYGHMSRLRRLLRQVPDETAVIAHGREEGYRLEIAADAIDLHAARALGSRARARAEVGDHAQAARLWRDACAMWRGSALTGLEGTWAEQTRENLRRERLTMLASRFDVELTLGRHAAIIGELCSAVDENPVAEELTAQLMLALYRLGRSAEALTYYEQTRIWLREELGAEPMPRLRQLHRHILNHDPDLEWTSATGKRVPAADTTMRSATDVHAAAAGTSVPLTAAVTDVRAPVADAIVRSAADVHAAAADAAVPSANEGRVAEADAAVRSAADVHAAAVGSAMPPVADKRAAAADAILPSAADGQAADADATAMPSAERIVADATVHAAAADATAVAPVRATGVQVGAADAVGPSASSVRVTGVRVGTADATVAPAQLPADTAAFTGRERQVETLLAFHMGHSDSPRPSVAPVFAVDGMAGVGKTAMAVHAAHRLARDFPDGQLFIDLHGYTPNVPPVRSTEALDRLLRALGTPAEHIPEHVDDRAAAFRTAMAGKRILLILDNAVSAEQVRPLLPASGANLTIVTSRARLSDLDDITSITLDVPSEPDVIELFCRAAGIEQPAAEVRQHVSRIAKVCGGLPLAVRIAAARLRSRPHWSVKDLLDRLTDAGHPLGQFESGRRSVAATFDVSYRELDDEARRAHRLLSLAPGADFGVHAAAALLDTSPSRAEALLEQLVDAHLLRNEPRDRWHFHDLMRQHAAEVAEAEESGPDRDAAVRRVIDMYCAAAREATERASTMVFQRPKPAPVNAPDVPDITDADEAISWWNRERRNLGGCLVQAVERGLDEQAFLAVTTLAGYFDVLGRTEELTSVSGEALRSARRRSGSVVESWMLTFHGIALFRVARFAEARDCFEQSLAIREHTDDVMGQVMLTHNLGSVDHFTGSFQRAAEYFERSRDLAERAGSELEAAQVAGNCALVYDRLGRRDSARRNLHVAQRLVDRYGGDRERAWVNLLVGMSYVERGDFDAARRHVQLASDGRDTVRDVEYQITEHLTAARVDHGTGLLDSAEAHCRHALRLCRENRQWRYKPEILNVLGRVLGAASRHGEAMEHYNEALKLSAESGVAYEEARAHRGLAELLEAGGDDAGARQHLKRAVELYAACGVPEADELRARLSGQPADTPQQS